MKEYYAKSNSKITIEEHSKKVAEKAIEIYKSTTIRENSEEIEIIRLASLLHDIGKHEKRFQSYLKSGKSKKKYIPHQFISWAFVHTICDINKDKDIISNIVFWHHGVQKLPSVDTSDILNELNDGEIESMIKYCENIGVKTHKNYDELIDDTYENIPSYYINIGSEVERNSKNSKLIYLRACVVLADRIVSGSDIDNSISSNELLFDKCPFDNPDRFNEQKSVVGNTTKTSIIKAPTGYGKTMMGLLWYEKNNQKTLWVCPRNTVAISTYHSIEAELNNAGKKLNLQLCYENEVKKSNFNENLETPDIIITNIDYYLRPYSDGGKDMSRLMFMLTANVIFDEYHELVSDSPLFSLFIYLMNLRNNKLKSKTLLLSGTPIELNRKWDNIRNRTTILPNNKSHLKAVHTKKYKVSILNEPPHNISDDSLYFTNTIKNCQRIGSGYNNSALIHSDFTKNDRDKKMNDLMSSYGKRSRGIKTPYISTLVLQAALDISFERVYDTPLSPETTLQRLGRCNRWGEKSGAELNIIINDKYDIGDETIIESLYTKNLNDKWKKELYKLDNKSLTLDDIYNLYNDFSDVNKKEINKFIGNKLNESSKSLAENIYPVKKRNFNEKDEKVFKASSNKLRSQGDEVFYIVKDDSGNWVGPFSKRVVWGWSKEFKESGNVLNDIKKEYKKSFITNSNYNYGNISQASYIKNITIDSIRHNAQFNISPYLALSFKYDNRLGVVK